MQSTGKRYRSVLEMVRDKSQPRFVRSFKRRLIRSWYASQGGPHDTFDEVQRIAAIRDGRRLVREGT